VKRGVGFLGLIASNPVRNELFVVARHFSTSSVITVVTINHVRGSTHFIKTCVSAVLVVRRDTLRIAERRENVLISLECGSDAVCQHSWGGGRPA
jgi:hypothetical protein